MAAGLQVDLRDHDLFARDDAAGQLGIELFERHGGPRILGGGGGSWHVLSRLYAGRFDLAMSTGRLPIRRNSESIRAMKTAGTHCGLNVGCLRVATLRCCWRSRCPALPRTKPCRTMCPPKRSLHRRYSGCIVSDKLVLNVYAEADQSSSRVATDRNRRCGRRAGARRRISSAFGSRTGREGWVGSNYLTGDAPAAVQLRELQRQQKARSQSADKKAAEEIARLKKESESLQTQVKELKAAAAAAPAAADDGVLEGASPAPQQLAAIAPTRAAVRSGCGC